MCNMVCGGEIDIATAQAAFATDWIAAYQTYYEARANSRQSPVGPPPSNSDCSIKGNVNSKGERIYHEPRDRDYDRVVMKNCDHGTCANGKRWFCTEDEARAAGWRPVRR